MEQIRECGDSRTDGGVYIEGPGYGPGGRPVEDFLIDPPRPIELAAYGITPVGQHLVEFDGVTHVADVVGETYYPYPWDYVREVGHGSGVSRKTSLGPAQLALLTPGKSRLMLLHRKAWLDNRADVAGLLSAQPAPENLGWGDFGCPQHQQGHGREMLAGWAADDFVAGDLPCCVGLWRFAVDVPGVTAGKVKADKRITATEEIGAGWHVVRRQLACGARWVGYGHADIVPAWRYAIFAVFPITNLVVVDPEGRHTAKAADIDEQAQFDVQTVPE